MGAVSAHAAILSTDYAAARDARQHRAIMARAQDRAATHLHRRKGTGTTCDTECGILCDRVPTLYRDLIDSPSDVTCVVCRRALR